MLDSQFLSRSRTNREGPGIARMQAWSCPVGVRLLTVGLLLTLLWKRLKDVLEGASQ